MKILPLDDFENQNQLYANNIKEALSKEETRSRKIRVLTTLPADLSKKRIRQEFNISHRMVSQAKALAVKSGFASEPPKKKRKKLLEPTREKVLDFYLSDDISRMMPGMKIAFLSSKMAKEFELRKDNYYLI